jgi:hypothetical protein
VFRDAENVKYVDISGTVYFTIAVLCGICRVFFFMDAGSMHVNPSKF